MTRLLVARAPTWRRIPLTVLAVTAQLLVAVVVIAFRIVRVAVNVTAALAMHAEQQLAERTGRAALSQTGVGALTAAFVQEFRTARHQPSH